MKITTILLSLLLFACGNPADVPDYGSQYDFVTPNGVRVRVEPGATWTPSWESLIDTYYLYESQCTGVPVLSSSSAVGPLVIFSNEQKIEDKDARFYPINGGTIVIGNQQSQLLPHEFVHYFLWTSGLPNDQNFSHQSPLFNQCGYPSSLRLEFI